jgi:hypothetical protein
MAVHVGELTSEVQVAGVAGGPPGPDRGAGPQPLQPSWAERERHQRLAEDQRRDRARVAEEGFDG